MVGSQMTLVAVPFQTYHLTHSNFMVGLVSVIQLPFLIAGSLTGGALGDRHDRRRIMAIGSAVLAVCAVGLGVNAALHGSVWIMCAVSATYVFVGGLTNPARSATVPRLVDADQLVAALSLNQITMQIGAVGGPALAGVLLAFIGLPSLYALDALSFLAVTVTAFAMRPVLPDGGASTTPFRRSIAEGFRYLRGHPLAQCVYLIDLNAMIFGMPRALFPALAFGRFHGSTQLFGLICAAPGLGALLGAVTTGWVGGVTRRGRAVVYAVIVWGLGITLFGLSPWPVLAIGALALAGWADVISAVLRNTILQTTVDDGFRSRLSAIQMAVVTGGPRLGDGESGLVASASSASLSVVTGGLACVAGAVALALWRPVFWRERAN
jgi:MFS family permease